MTISLFTLDTNDCTAALYRRGRRGVLGRVDCTRGRRGRGHVSNLGGTLDRIQTGYSSDRLHTSRRGGVTGRGSRITRHRRSLTRTGRGNSTSGVTGHRQGLTRTRRRLGGLRTHSCWLAVIAACSPKRGCIREARCKASTY